MSRPPSTLLRTAASRHPSPTTLAAANAEQAAASMPRDAALQDGVLLVLSYEDDNIFVLANSTYEHVLDSALVNFSALRNTRTERAHLRLALQTKLGSNSTLVYITADTWPAVALRARVVTVLVHRPLSPPTETSPTSRPKLPPPASHRGTSPGRETDRSWSAGSPNPSWHSYPPGGYPPLSSPRGLPRSLAHSRQHSSSTAHYPYAHMHYLPAPPNALSISTDPPLAARPVNEPEPRQECSVHLVPAKRHWDPTEDTADERPYTRPPPDTPSTDARTAPSHDDTRKQPKRTRAWNPPDHQYSCRRCQRTDSPAWRKGPEGPKTLCNACGLSYAKELARRESAAAPTTPPERPVGYVYNSNSTAHSSRSGRTAGVKTLDGSDAALAMSEGSLTQRECSTCKRTDSPQWRKGPAGPNTLCNSCGLAWARTQRKSEGTHSGPGSSRSASPVPVPPTYHQATPPVKAPPLPGSAAVSPSAHGRPPPRSALGEEDELLRSSSVASHRAQSPVLPTEP